ncbi:hypothetical protein OKA06_13240 [Novosphingobium sp. MW5]|nr:hypothetical protein [Novosphingobium sp. MW5]
MKAIRFYHLLFAAGCLLAWFTAEELGLVHAWTGYVVAGLVAIRLMLGLAGNSGFQMRRLMPTGGVRNAGSPAVSSALALALFVAVAGTAGTGIAMDQGGTLVGTSIRADDGKERHGEGRGEHGEDEKEALAPSSMLGLAPAARAEEGEGGEREEGLLGEVHETLGNLILPLAILHALYLLVFRLNMARFMLFLNRRSAKA